MIGYIKKITQGIVADTRRVSPANADLFDIDPTSLSLSSVEKESFHTKVAQLLYLAKRARLDLLTAVSHLASRVSCPSVNDQKKLNDVLSYLINTMDRKMMLKSAGRPFDFNCYIDASYGGEDDATSRSGVVVYACGVAILGWSSKQKLVVKSACEAEIVALSDGLSHVLWIRNLLKEQYCCISTLKPTVVFQDNKGVIALMDSENSPQHRTKHMKIRHFWAREQAKLGEIVIEYLPTADTIADLMTKPVTGSLFVHLVDMLFGSV